MKLVTERVIRATMPMPVESMVESTLDERMREALVMRPRGRPRPRVQPSIVSDSWREEEDFVEPQQSGFSEEPKGTDDERTRQGRRQECWMETGREGSRLEGCIVGTYFVDMGEVDGVVAAVDDELLLPNENQDTERVTVVDDEEETESSTSELNSEEQAAHSSFTPILDLPFVSLSSSRTRSSQVIGSSKVSRSFISVRLLPRLY